MYSICLIDDLCYGISQVIHSIPDTIEYEFFYFDRVASIESRNYDIVLLDYYLDKDGTTGEDIFDTIHANIVIGFSSEDDKNILLTKKGAKFKAKKLKNTVKNPDLTLVMESIFIK